MTIKPPIGDRRLQPCLVNSVLHVLLGYHARYKQLWETGVKF
jgi:hypothetical protein